MRDDDLDDTVITPRPGRASDAGAASALVGRGDTVAGGEELADTVVPRRPRHLGAPPAGAPAVPDVPAPTSTRPAARVPSVRVRGQVIRLDHPVLVGRRPAVPRIVTGPPPELVTVPSRSGQVSGSHVLVHATGTTVVVEDLRSTNGTVVRMPGAAPIRMRAGASIVVLTGTVVDIGDGNAIEILSPHLRVSPTAPNTGAADAAAPADPRSVGVPIPPIPGFHN